MPYYMGMIVVPFICFIAAILMGLWARHEKSTPMYGMALCLLLAALASVMILAIVNQATATTL